VNSDSQVALLVARVEQLSSQVERLLETLPNPERQWLKPGEFAKIVGCSSRSLANWRDQGRFRKQSIRQSGNSWQFHCRLALEDVEAKK
jgi:hypothetical protein